MLLHKDNFNNYSDLNGWENDEPDTLINYMEE
jgi:hypothetical protein